MSAYNPYDFVPIAETVARKTRKEWQKAGERLSGHLICKIEPISPLCIDPDHIFKEDAKQVYIPATSLKGMLRQLVATLAEGCGEFIDRDYWYPVPKGETTFNRPPNDYAIPDYLIEYFVTHNRFSSNEDYADSDFRSCGHIIDSATDGAEPQICRTCYLFGYTAENDSLAGRIHIHDSEKESVNLVQKSILRLDQPRVYRTGFYFKNALQPTIYPHPGKPTAPPPPNYPTPVQGFQGSAKNGKKWSGKPQGHKFVHYQQGIYNGRKFYRHPHDGDLQEYVQQTESDAPDRLVYVLTPDSGIIFTQKVSFADLSRDDLGLLIFALVLLQKPDTLKMNGSDVEDNMRHKLGYAKPLGAGSVRITVSDDLLLQSQHRYGALAAQAEEPKDATSFRDTFVMRHGVLESIAFKKLQRIWRWPGYEIAYPSVRFFGNKYKKAVTLDEYNPDEEE